MKYETVEEPYTYTVCVPTTETRTRTVKVCEYVPEERTKTVTICEWATEERTKTVNICEWATEERTKTVERLDHLLVGFGAKHLVVHRLCRRLASASRDAGEIRLTTTSGASIFRRRQRRRTKGQYPVGGRTGVGLQHP